MKTIKSQLNKLKIISVLLITLCFALSSYSSNNAEIIAGGERITIHSKVLNEDRVILISVPDNYDNTDMRFPVLYVLDGSTHFRHAVGATDYLARYGLAPGIIVVAITNVDRNRDLSPVHVDNIPTSGGAEKFHEFIKKELMPNIEKNYRTTDYNILMGHSFGGTFAGYSLLDHPDVFNAYIAVSPFLQYADNYVVKEAKQKLKPKYNSPKSFFMTVGDEPDYFNALDEFSSLMQEKSDNAINFLYVQMPGENHITTPYVTLYNGLRFTFSDWVLSNETFKLGLSAIDEHYDSLSKKYYYEIAAPENTINLLGYNYLQAGETSEAIKVFQENVKRFPNSANVYDSLGEAYENNDQLKLAKENYSKAYKLGIEQGLATATIYKTNLDRVSK